jgi:uncharacterized protein YcbX
MEPADGFVIEQIWRYPVKSLRGELVGASDVDMRGLLGDRLWAVRDADGRLGSGKNSRRFRRLPGLALLSVSAHYPVEPSAGPSGVEPPVVVGADGREYPVGDGSADAFFRRESGDPGVSVAREAQVSHFDEEPISLIGSATLQWVERELSGVATDARRFRPNLVVRTSEPFTEESWVGRTVRVGAGDDAVELVFSHVLSRCVMTCVPQDDLPPAPGMLKMLALRVGQPLRLAVVGAVARAGVVRLGDAVQLADASKRGSGAL